MGGSTTCTAGQPVPSQGCTSQLPPGHACDQSSITISKRVIWRCLNTPWRSSTQATTSGWARLDEARRSLRNHRVVASDAKSAVGVQGKVRQNQVLVVAMLCGSVCYLFHGAAARSVLLYSTVPRRQWALNAEGHLSHKLACTGPARASQLTTCS